MKILNICKISFVVFVSFLITQWNSVAQAQGFCETANFPTTLTTGVPYQITIDTTLLQPTNGQSLSVCGGSNRPCVWFRGCFTGSAGGCSIRGDFPIGTQSLNGNILTVSDSMANDFGTSATFKFWLVYDSGTIVQTACDLPTYRIALSAPVAPPASCGEGTFSNPVVAGTQNRVISFNDPIEITFDGSKTSNFPNLGRYGFRIFNAQGQQFNTGNVAFEGGTDGKLRAAPGLQLNHTFRIDPLPYGNYTFGVQGALQTEWTCSYPLVVTPGNVTGTPPDINVPGAGSQAVPFVVKYCNPSKTVLSTALGCIPTDAPGLFKALFTIATGMAGGIAFLLVLFGGFKIIMSSGNPESMNEGKEIVSSAITGLLLILFSIFFLRILGVDILAIPGFG